MQKHGILRGGKLTNVRRYTAGELATLGAAAVPVDHWVGESGPLTYDAAARTATFTPRVVPENEKPFTPEERAQLRALLGG